MVRHDNVIERKSFQLLEKAIDMKQPISTSYHGGI